MESQEFSRQRPRSFEDDFRDFLREFFERSRPYLGIFLLLLILSGGGVWAFFRSGGADPITIVGSETASSAAPPAPASPASSSASPSPSLVVDLAGAVRQPGVYRLDRGARVQDALRAAGGLSDRADTDWVAKNLNLAAKLADGDKIYIPRQGETKPNPGVATPGSAGVVAGTTVGVSGGSGTSDTRGGGDSCPSIVNINSASAGTLDDCLTGIGPAYARRIVEYREAHGDFKSIEEIQNVRGIGPATFAKIKERITVN